MPLVIPAPAPPYVKVGQTNTYTTGSQDLTSATSLIVPASAGYAPTADASLGYDTTRDAWSTGGAGALNGKLVRCLSAQFSTTDTLTASTITTNETNFATNFSVPANFFIANKVIRLSAYFEITTSGSPPTSTYRVKMGTTALFTGGAATATANVTAKGSGISWILQGTAAAGASVAVETGSLLGFLVVGTGAGPANQTAQPVNIATNSTLTLQISIQYSANTAGNSATLRQLLVEELN